MHGMNVATQHELEGEPTTDARQYRYRALSLSGIVVLLLIAASVTNPTSFSNSNLRSAEFTPMETDDGAVDPGVNDSEVPLTTIESQQQSLNIGMGCPEFQLAFDSATPGSTTPFRSFTLTKGSGYGYVSLHFSKLWMPLGASVVLRAVEGFDTPDRMMNLSVSYPSGQNYGSIVAPRILTKEFRIEFYRSEISNFSIVDEEDLITDSFIVTDSNAECFGFVVDSYDYLLMNDNDPIVATEASICASDNTENAICYYPDNTTRTAYLASRSVARLKIPKGSDQWASCTGWLLGNQGHIMTNFHCVGSDAEASGTTVEIMAESMACTNNDCELQQCSGEMIAYTMELVHASAVLDYALLKLPSDGAKTAETYGYLRLKTRDGIVGEQLYIPQHPMGANKRLAVEDDYASNVALLSLSSNTCGSVGYSYSGDTQTGSSGSPVISFADHGVVALHHCGEMCANTGIPAKDILADLRVFGINVAEFDGVDDESNHLANAERFPEYTSPAIEVMLPLLSRLSLDGSIVLASGFVTIDKVEFTLVRDTDVSFGVISVEITDNDTFVDLNGDCRASYLDSVIYLFAKGISNPIFTVDDRNPNDIMDDGSISYRDPYKSIFLKKGAYIFAIAPTGSRPEDALAGKAKVYDAPELYTCRTHGTYGSYRLKISSTVGNNPFQFTRLPATTGIDPTQCYKTAEEICPS